MVLSLRDPHVKKVFFYGHIQGRERSRGLWHHHKIVVSRPSRFVFSKDFANASLKQIALHRSTVTSSHHDSQTGGAGRGIRSFENPKDKTGPNASSPVPLGPLKIPPGQSFVALKRIMDLISNGPSGDAGTTRVARQGWTSVLENRWFSCDGDYEVETFFSA